MSHLPPYYIAELTEKQVQLLDFTKKDIINNSVQKGICYLGMHREDESPKRIQFLLSDQIIDGLNHDTLNLENLTSLSKEQIAEIDFRRVENTTEKNQLFSYIFNRDNVPSLGLNSVNRVVPHLSPFHISALKKEQVQFLNFTRKDIINDNVQQGIADQYSNDKLIRFLSSQQIIDGLNYDTLNERALQAISPEQMAEINNTQLNPNARDKFNRLHR